MAWFKKVRKPIEAANKESRVPEGLWVKCPSCSQIIYNKDLASSLSVCTKCGRGNGCELCSTTIGRNSIRA
jgi:acetyl-CoA carboxylase carboxyl transferase subunit beta